MGSKMLVPIDSSFYPSELVHETLYHAKTPNPTKTKHPTEAFLETKEKLDYRTMEIWKKPSFWRHMSALITEEVLIRSKCIEKSSYA